MKFPKLAFDKLGNLNTRVRSRLAFVAVVAVLGGSALGLLLTLPQPVLLASDTAYPHGLRTQYDNLVVTVNQLESKQRQTHYEVVSDTVLQQMLSRVQIELAARQFHQAEADIKLAKTSLDNWNLELRGGAGPAVAAGGPATGVFIPIVLYHYTPPDFERQLEYLEQHNYTVIDMNQALAGLHGGQLPPKPVVLTFDDGFENQMQAFEILKRHNMKATFYIIDAGEASRWCIGAGRRYHDSLQPPGGCGDAYLTWDQVRMLDKSGLITIGGHTVNHRNLASLSAAEQQMEIAQGKVLLEQQLGHTVLHFAYPYGAYNAESIQIAKDAGYLTAVTTMPGDYQPAGSDFTLRRIRDTLSLP